MPHTVGLHPDTVIKRFGPGHAEAYEREHRALTLLAAHAPGLAPAPLPSEPPVLVMTRLPGAPLRGTGWDPGRVAALARTVATLHSAIPAPLLSRLPARPDQQDHVVRQIHAWHSSGVANPGGDPRVAEALTAGMSWLARTGLDPDPGLEPVFGPGDGNLANYLWDGTAVTVVDFEFSGRSDRPYELAEITEHVSSWVETELDTAAFLGHFHLTAAETARLRDCRRLLSLVWLFMLSLDDPAHPRNPPGTARRQAARLLERLTPSRSGADAGW